MCTPSDRRRCDFMMPACALHITLVWVFLQIPSVLWSADRHTHAGSGGDRGMNKTIVLDAVFCQTGKSTYWEQANVLLIVAPPF